MSLPLCRLYLITPPVLEDLTEFSSALKAALGAGDVAALQIRLKEASEAHIAAVTRALMPIAHAHDVAVILNDRPDLAARLNCDGVHIGQQDGSFAEARRLVGPGRMVGVTCHDSRHLAMHAAEAGADYVAFGAFFPTKTKQAGFHAEPELLSVWQETMQTPCVAIGGITVDNARGLAQAGADFLAVASGVWDDPLGPAAAVKALNVEIAEGVKARSE
jgi:thiamine-phosphate pyrophosphorylase